MHSYQITGLIILAYLFATIKAEKVVSRIWVEEEKPKGHPVAEMSTILTHNSGKHGTVRYKLLYGMENSIPSDGKSVSNPFGGKSTPGTPWVDLNEDTGSLTLNRRLNRERDCVDKGAVCSVQFQVVLLPQDIFKIADMTLTLTDINDNPPVFPVRQTSLNISEDANVGTEINLDRYQAMDSDIGNNSAIQYSLSSSKIFSLKQFTDRTGLRHLRLLLRQRLDYSKAKYHKLVLTATDRGKNPLSGNITFIVNVQDANDHAPVFAQKQYRVTLREDQAIGGVIGRVYASDADPGTLGVVTYRITSSSSGDEDDDELIDVNRHSGEVILRKRLDRAIYDGTRVIIEARDGSVDNPKTDETVFVITVDDINDNAPEITISYIVDAEDDIIYVSELDPINTFLAHISATDADNGNNGEVRIQVHSYSIIKDDEDKNTTLEIDSNCVFLDAQGLLGTGCVLDRESQDLYKVVIEACDKGSPNKCTKQNITIIILDENEYAPKFVKSRYRIKMPESSDVGSYVATCIAKDGDSVESQSAIFKNKEGKMVKSRNGEITYTLRATNGKAVTYSQNDEQIPFELDVITGKITLLRPLDYESAKKWKVTVTARDGNDKAPKMATCNVTVSLDDVNDNRPVFTSPASDNMTITISIREHSNFVINLTVVDFDHEIVNEITYDIEAIYMVEHENRYTKMSNKIFNVNKHSGEINILGKSEDNIGKYFFKIRAFDSENLSSSRAIGLFVVICDCTIQEASAALTVALGLGAAAVFLLIVVFGITIVLIRRHRIASKTKKRDVEEDNKEENGGGLVVRTKRDSQSSRSDVFASPRSTTSSRHSDMNKKGTNNNKTRSNSCGGAPPGQCYVCDLSNSSPSLTDHSPYHTLVANMIIGKKSEAQVASSPSDHDSGRGSSDTRSDLMEKNTHREKPNEHYYCPYPPTVDENTELSDPCSDYSGKLRSPQQNNGMGPHCSPACREIGHCDTCWMPSGIGSDKQKEPYRKMRHGSECSTETDTTSSGASYYRMTPNLKMSSSFTTASNRRRGSDGLPKSMISDYANSGHCKHKSLGNDGALRAPSRPFPNVPETHYVTAVQNPLSTDPRNRASWARCVNPGTGYMSMSSNVNSGTMHEIGRIGRTTAAQRSPEKQRRTSSLTRTAIV